MFSAGGGKEKRKKTGLPYITPTYTLFLVLSGDRPGSIRHNALFAW